MKKTEKIQFYISFALKILLGLLTVASLLRGDYFTVFASSLVLLISFLPAIISHSLKVRLPHEIDLTLTVILYLHYVLGEYEGFYNKVAWWDLFLHSGNSVILGLVGFVFAYVLLMTSRISAKPFFISLFSLSLSVFIGVMWEVFEFVMDQAFGFNMQKSGLVDTMTDLMADVLGAFSISVLGFFYIKRPWPGLLHKAVMGAVRFWRKGKQALGTEEE